MRPPGAAVPPQEPRRSASRSDECPRQLVPAAKPVDLEIEQRHAWAATGRPGDAHLRRRKPDRFRQRSRSTMPRSGRRILKGSADAEMVAMKDGNEIYARELSLRRRPERHQQAAARGPGRIGDARPHFRPTDLAGSMEGNAHLHQGWAHDLLALNGDATFEDREHAQHLQADVLKLWLEAGLAVGTAKEPQRRRPHHLDATGRVVAHSPELNVHDTERLVVWFKDRASGRCRRYLPRPAGAGSSGPVPAPSAAASAPGPPRVRAITSPLPGLVVPPYPSRRPGASCVQHSALRGRRGSPRAPPEKRTSRNNRLT